jgi:hypothetical protein
MSTADVIRGNGGGFQVRDLDGSLVFDQWDPRGPNIVPVKIFVTPWFAERSLIPDGDGKARALRPRLPYSADLERVIDHVTGWEGFRAGPAPTPPLLACTRDNVRAFLRSSPDLFRQTREAIEAVSQSGVIGS